MRSSISARLVAKVASTAALVLAAALIGACGNDSKGEAGSKVLAVPGDYRTIQAAVDASRPGDLVLVGAGTYAEAVKVSTKNITIRGEDRNKVILDGGDDLFNGFTVTADGVAVENLTIHSYRQSGLVFDGFSALGGGDAPDDYTIGAGTRSLNGYRAAYVTSYNNGTYGVYAFGARNGTFDHVYTSGHPDSGIYIGQCKPCNAVVSHSEANYNAVGYFGTNASGEVYIVESSFTGNRLGLAPNSQNMEELAPQAQAVLAGNFVDGTGAELAPPLPSGGFGMGISVGGGTSDIVTKNRVINNLLFGIGLTNLNSFKPMNNKVTANALSGNGLDLFASEVNNGGDSMGNCFAGNQFESAAPSNIEQALPCTGPPESVVSTTLPSVESPPSTDYRNVKPPDRQPTMPGDLRKTPTKPAGPPPKPDLAAIKLPAGDPADRGG